MKCGLICSLQIIEGYSARNLTSGEIRTDVCQSPSWHPSHGGAVITEEEAVCRDVWGHQMDVSGGATFAVGQEFTVSLH